MQTQLTKDILAGIAKGLSRKEVAKLTGATSKQVSAAIHNNAAATRNRLKALRRKHTLKCKEEAGTITSEEVLELAKLRKIPLKRKLVRRPEIELVSAPKYSLLERIRILFKGY